MCKSVLASFFCSSKMQREGRREEGGGERERGERAWASECLLQGQGAAEWLHWSVNAGSVAVGFSSSYLLQRIPADRREAHMSFTLCSCCWRAGMPSGEVLCRTDSPLVTIIFIWISFSCFTDNRACNSKYRSLVSFACWTSPALNISELPKIVEWYAIVLSLRSFKSGRVTCWWVPLANHLSPAGLQVTLALQVSTLLCIIPSFHWSFTLLAFNKRKIDCSRIHEFSRITGWRTS